MPLNPLIPLQTQPVQAHAGGDLVDLYTKKIQLDALRGQAGLRALQMAELERQLREQHMAQEFLRGGGAYVGGGAGMPRPAMPPPGTPSPAPAGPIIEAGGYMSAEPMNAAAGQVAVPRPQEEPGAMVGAVAQSPDQPPVEPARPQRRQLKPLSELAVEFYSRFPSIAGPMVKQFDDAIKTEQQGHKTLQETLKAQQEAQKYAIEAKQKHLELMTSVLNGMSGNPERYQEGIAALRELNVPDGLINLLGPTYSQANIDKLRMMGADQKTLLEQQSKQADRMLEYQKFGLEQQKHGLEREKYGLEQQREQRLGSEVIPVDTGAEQVLVPRYGGAPGGGGVTGTTLPSAKEHAVMAPARAEMIKEAAKHGNAARASLDVLGQMETLYQQGVYPVNRTTKWALTYLNETGSAPPNYDKDMLVRTQEFINRSERLTLAQLNEQTLTPVTDADLAVVRRAGGNFATASSKEAIELSFKEARELAQRRANQADDIIKQAQSGKLGGYGDAVRQQNANRPLPPNPPGQRQGAKPGQAPATTLSASEYERGLAAAQKMGYSKEQYDQHLTQQGLRGPR